ncbi:hypothetical protein ACF5W4_11120 [Bacillota bacterium Lsc_1132]
MDYYVQEIDALQRWIYKAATLTSMRLQEAPPSVPRPIILWEMPQRSRMKNLNQYTYVVRVRQYGKLFVSSFDQAAIFQDKLLNDLEEKYGVLPVYESGQATALEVAKLKQVDITFNNSESLDIPLVVTYEITYGRTRPAAAPAAATVKTTLTTT